MTAIPPFDRSSSFPSPTTNLPVLAEHLGQDIKKFHDLLPPTPDHLEEFAKAVQILHDVSKSALPYVQNPSTRLGEAIQDAATTTQTILNQPLEIPGAKEDISLLKAAQSFRESENQSSDLAKVARTFSQYPDLTTSLKIELTEACHELGLTK